MAQNSTVRVSPHRSLLDDASADPASNVSSHTNIALITPWARPRDQLKGSLSRRFFRSRLASGRRVCLGLRDGSTGRAIAEGTPFWTWEPDGATRVRFRTPAGFSPRYNYSMVAAVMLLLGVGRDIKHTPATYVDSATIVFKTNKASLALNPNSTVDGSLITTDAVTVESLMDSSSSALVRRAGGTADFNLSLINFDNQDFPDYSYPLATLTTQS